MEGMGVSASTVRNKTIIGLKSRDYSPFTVFDVRNKTIIGLK